jgi:hypothetical protein
LDTAKEFVENLRASKAFVDVYFDEKFFASTPDGEMARAKTSTPVTARTVERTASAKRSSGGGLSGGGLGSGGMQGLSSVGSSQAGAAAAGGTGIDVFQFHVDVQVVGKPIKREAD